MNPWLPIIPFFFWALLVFPGYAIARRVVPKELESGPIAGIAVCAMCVLVGFLPIVALGYFVGMPIWILSSLLVASIIWGIYDTIRYKTWKLLSKVLLGVIGIEVLFLLIDVVLSERLGSILAADARVHVARIRFLMENGLTNQDPYVPEPAFYPIYHTNLHHALIAAASRLLNLDPIIIWFGSLGMAKVLIASGIGYLTWVVLPSRWAIAVAVVFVVISRGPVTFSIYPNQLAPWFLFPVVMGACIRTTSGWSPKRAFLTVLAVSLVLGSFHGLYAGFAFLIGSSILGVIVLWRLFSRARRVQARAPALALVGLAIGALSFPLISNMMTIKPGTKRLAAVAERMAANAAAIAEERAREIAAQQADQEEEFVGAVGVQPEVALDYVPEEAPDSPLLLLTDDEIRRILIQRSLPKVDGFARQDGMIWREWGRGYTGTWRERNGFYLPHWRLIGLVVGMIVVGVFLKRSQPFELLAGFVTVLTVMLTPQLCTAAYRFLGEFWMVLRFETLAEVLWIPLAVPPIVMALERVVRYRVLQSILTIALIPIGVRHAYLQSPYSWDFYWNRAKQSERWRHKRELIPLLRLSERLQRAIPEDAIIATHPENADYLAMLVDANFAVSERSSSGVYGLGKRKKNVRRMLSFDIEEEERAELFKRFDITHVIMADRIRDWVPFWTDQVGRIGRWRIAPVWEEPDFTRIALKHMRKGLKAMHRGDYFNAIPNLELALESETEREDLWFRLGNARAWTGDSGGAIEAYERVIDLDPSHSNAYLMLGNAMNSQGRPDQAEVIYEKVIEMGQEQGDYPIAASAAFNIGNAAFRESRFEDAIRSYEMALQFQPYHLEAQKWMDEAWRWLESTDEETDEVTDEETDQE